MKIEEAGKLGASQLGQLFESLSGSEIARFTRAIESDRVDPKLPLPHETILQILRPRLASLKPERYPTPMRQFCDPIEDLLTSAMPPRAMLINLPLPKERFGSWAHVASKMRSKRLITA